LLLLINAALAASTLLVYWQVHSFDFVSFDDSSYVYRNPHVISGLTMNNVVWAFSSGHASNWHPLTWLSHMLDCQLFGLRPGPMHLVNVILHIANTLLLFLLLKSLTGRLWRSAFVAAVFAMHPMHVESVAWIAERKDVLSTLFLLLTLLAYVCYARHAGKWRYVLTATLFACGLLTKPMLVTLPVLMLLLDYWPLGRLGKRTLVEKIPFFALSAASSILTFLVQRAGGSLVDNAFLPLQKRLANAVLSYARYIGKLFWPENLAAYYPLDAGKVSLWLAVICAIIGIVISILAIRYGRKHKYLVTGWFWYVVTLLPVIGLIQIGSQEMADRYSYVSYVGLLIVLAWGWAELTADWRHGTLLTVIACAIVLSSLLIVTYRQIGYWKDSLALFTRAIDVTSGNDIAYNNRGNVYMKLGKAKEAIDDLTKAINIMPTAEAYNNRALALNKLGKGQEAIEDLEKAALLKPWVADIYANMGMVYSRMGKGEDAVGAYQQALRVRPDNAATHYDLANELLRLGRSEEADREYRKAQLLEPERALK
jgi:protein O-mannosyl-transferase